MTIAPYVEDPEENRPVFRKLKELSVDIAAKNINNVRMAILKHGHDRRLRSSSRRRRHFSTGWNRNLWRTGLQ